MRQLKDRPIALPLPFGAIDKKDLNTVEYLDFQRVELYLSRWLQTTGSLSPNIASHQTTDLVRPFFEELWNQDQVIDSLLKGALMDNTRTEMLMGDHGSLLTLPQAVQTMNLSEYFFRNLLTWLRFTYYHGSLKGSVKQGIEQFFHSQANFDEWYLSWQQPFNTGKDISDQHGFELNVSHDLDNPFQFSFDSILLLGRLLRYVRPAHKIPHLMIRVLKKTWMNIKESLKFDLWVNKFTDMTFGCYPNLVSYWVLGDCSVSQSKQLCDPSKRPSVSWGIGAIVAPQSKFGWRLGVCDNDGECRELCSIAAGFSIKPLITYHGAVKKDVAIKNARVLGDRGIIEVRADLEGDASYVYGVSLEASSDHYTWTSVYFGTTVPGRLIRSFDSTSLFTYPQLVYLRFRITTSSTDFFYDLPPLFVSNNSALPPIGLPIIGELSQVIFNVEQPGQVFLTGAFFNSSSIVRISGNLGTTDIIPEILNSNQLFFEFNPTVLLLDSSTIGIGSSKYRSFEVSVVSGTSESNKLGFYVELNNEPTVTNVSIAAIPATFPTTVEINGSNFSPATLPVVSNQTKIPVTSTVSSIVVQVDQSDLKWGQLSFSVVDPGFPDYESNAIVLRQV